jgi:parallel beta-helix repeat protein
VFTGAASGISVSRIYGRFVRINIFDAINSIVQDCDFRGGKGTFASLMFDNATNNVQQGQNNQALNNRISYSSQCGITFFANVDFTIRGNTCFNCGQSGTQTAQAGGIAFTGSVGGATSGTLNAPWAGVTGTWQFGFSDGSVRTGTLTNGNTGISWTSALAAASILTAAVWGASGSPASIADPRCGRGVIVNNRCYNNYYDGLDCLSTFGPPVDATQSHHQIHDNYSFRNRGTGINVDGQFNSIIANHIYFNGTFGIWGAGLSLSEVTGNTLIDDNQSRNAGGLAEILAVGTIALNKIADNYIWGGPTQNCSAIVVTQSALNYVSDNIGVGVSNNNLGNIGSVTSVADGNIDSLTGALTPQCFAFELVNNAGTLQHVFFADSSNQSAGLYSRINAATSGGFTTTPAGADGATAMAAGAKIGSGLTNAIWFDTAVQNPTGDLISANIVFNNTGTALNVQPMFQSININGVTRQRLTFQFTNQTTGAVFALTVANITAGKGIYVQFNGKLS